MRHRHLDIRATRVDRAGLLLLSLFGIALLAASVALDQPWRTAAVASTLAGAAAVIWLFAARQSALVAKLRNLISVDELTGLLNRRGYGERIEIELSRSRRQGTELALVVADVDNFKELNDRLGHLGGDMGLERLGGAIDRTRRATDVPARLGGDEFAILLPDTSALQAVTFSDRLRASVQGSFAGTATELTLSLGIAVFPADAQSAEELFHAADQAMYRAKALGKDRTAVFGRDLGIMEGWPMPSSSAR